MEFRVSFTLVLTVLTLILSLTPAIVIWVVFMDLMTSSVDLLKDTTQESIDAMARRMQEMLMSEAVAKFDARLAEGEEEMLVYRALLKASGVLGRDLHPARFDSLNEIVLPYRPFMFATMQGHDLFAVLAVSGALFPDNVTTVGFRSFMLSYVALYLDLATNSYSHTQYLGTMAMTRDEQFVDYNRSYPDQDTGLPLVYLSQVSVPSAYLMMHYAPAGWDTQLSFDTLSGQVQLTRWEWMQAQNNTRLQISLSISAETLSDELRQQLSDAPSDRLVLFFREPHGYMIAASHGKYWSDSDVDRRHINPLTNPPNISAYRLWNCMQSNDALISQACQQLYAQYQSWTAIPALRQETVLHGDRYWVATDFSTGSATLQCTVLMLKNRASVMGSIDASNAEVDQSVADKKGVTYVVLGVISALAVLLPVALGCWLASRLYRLAAGMDRIAKLQFHSDAMQPSVFQELHRFQTSFIQMERGLQAFGKFVPQAVVRVLIAGQMKATDEMNPETLTIMFADMEGFSTVCEHVLPSVLVTVCTEYFEAMCNIIVQHNGTIDKFIGDCIMAMWNAPDRLPGHERDAVAAALAMQTSVMQLHPSWQQRGLPVLKFRLGIHTGVCLVGNFGCSYRVSYTCLGDGVNLSARLEALNKKFGTYLCVSHATYSGCCEDFHFRRLARVTVPGKAEVLPVYEVLCEVEPGERPKSLSPKVGAAPGVVNLSDSLPNASSQSLEYVSPVGEPSNAGQYGPVVYHWAYMDRATLLRQARDYELAYEAMVAGNQAGAQHVLMAKTPQSVRDTAWAALTDQLAHTDPGRPWDGVFYFCEK